MKIIRKTKKARAFNKERKSKRRGKEEEKRKTLMPCGYAVNVEIMDDSAEIAHNSHIHLDNPAGLPTYPQGNDDEILSKSKGQKTKEAPAK